MAESILPIEGPGRFATWLTPSRASRYALRFGHRESSAMGLKFGTSGLRGLVSELSGEASGRYVTAFVGHMVTSGAAQAGGPVFVGRDLRESSPRIAADCMAAIAASGLRPIDCGAVPTPALALHAMMKKAPALMVTGSHIPADRNGIKFYRPDGEIDKADEVQIVALAARDSYQPPENAPPPEEERNVDKAYLARYAGFLSEKGLSGRRIGVYQHSGVSRDLLVALLEGFGADVVPLGRADHFVPIDTEAVSPDTLEALQKWASEHRLDAIVSTDGDADRPLLADENGVPLRGDLLGLATAVLLGARTVATPVTSNSSISRDLGFDVVRTKVGSPYVIGAMLAQAENDASKVIGFEANGGVLTASTFTHGDCVLTPLPTRDAFLPLLACLAIAERDRLKLSQLAAHWKMRGMASDRLENFPTEWAQALLSHLHRSKANLEIYLHELGVPDSVDDTDGIRVTLVSGDIVHYRASGNAPELRCYAEAASDRLARELVTQGLNLARRFGGNAPEARQV